MENGLPDWVTWVATGIGITLATIAARMGLGGGSPASTTTAAEVAGALIDQKAAKEITDALSASVRQYVDVHEEQMEFEREARVRAELQLKDFVDEVRELRKELRELGREISHARSRTP